MEGASLMHSKKTSYRWLELSPYALALVATLCGACSSGQDENKFGDGTGNVTGTGAGNGTGSGTLAGGNGSTTGGLTGGLLGGSK